MSEDIVPTYNKEQLCAFMTAKQLAGVRFPELLPTMPKFLIHVPKIDDGKTMIMFPNIKKARIDYEEGATTLKIQKAEGLPQRVPMDGKGWIVINASDADYASMWKRHLNQAYESGRFKGDPRNLIEDLLFHIQGFKLGFKEGDDGLPVIDPHTIILAPDHRPSYGFDVYSMPQRDKELKYEKEPYGSYSRGQIAGLFYKKPEPYKTFFIKGHFKVEYDRSDSWHQVQEYHDGAYITIDPRGEISSINPSNMKSCYGFLKEGVRFEDIQPGKDRGQYVTQVSDKQNKNRNKVPEFTQAEVNGTIALHSMGYPSRGGSGKVKA